jgi:acetyl esterase/lipase
MKSDPAKRHWQVRLVPLIVALIVGFTQGAEAQQVSEAVDRASDAYLAAQRLMKRIDTDGSGSLKEGESVKLWRRYRKLDTNQDKVLTVEELSLQRLVYLETGGERNLDVVYKTVGKRKLLLDLYYPTGERDEAVTAPPVVIYVHGGGWAAGNKQGIAKGAFKKVFQRLVEQGFAVVSVNYRLCKKGSDVTMRDCVVDCKDSVRYLAKNGEALKIDAERVFVMGDSAGGHLAQMLLLTSPESLPGDEKLESASYKILGGVSWYGPCDFENTDLFNHDDRDDFRDRFGNRILGRDSDPDDKSERYREVSPVNYLRQDSPPLLMIQGNKDTTIPVKHAHFMKQKADELKAHVDIMIINNSGHNWRKVDAEIEPSREAIVERTVEFFVDRLEQ